ncbi:hypothetical protein R1sor_025368 [Riccia sorocarpa]|uniref:DDE Tnp4 domain-containing protein n=1 Tax=Riccia sorocarpa TaxID=122646 RepID=A0ABD3G8F7_9MARC
MSPWDMIFMWFMGERLFELGDLSTLMWEEGDDDILATEYIMLFLFMEAWLEQQTPRTRTRDFWILPRQHTWWDVIHKQVWHMNSEFLNTHMRKRYRMSYESFTRLVVEIGEFMPTSSEWPLARKRMELEKCVSVVVYRFTHNTPLRTLANMYCIGEANVMKYTCIIIEILTNKLKMYSKYIRAHTEEEATEIMWKFEQISGIPQIVGCIDGSHVKLRTKPALKYLPEHYKNRHSDYSVLLQDVSDADLRFWDLCCNMPGSTHDAAHLRQSSVYHSMETKRILAAPTIRMDSESGPQIIPPIILGDSAYPIREWLIKRIHRHFHQGSETENEFDRHMSKAREKIENAFGHLKGRWTILRDCPMRLDLVPRVVLACGVLHNFVICQEEALPLDADAIDEKMNGAYLHSLPGTAADRAKARKGFIKLLTKNSKLIVSNKLLNLAVSELLF